MKTSPVSIISYLKTELQSNSAKQENFSSNMPKNNYAPYTAENIRAYSNINFGKKISLQGYNFATKNGQKFFDELKKAGKLVIKDLTEADLKKLKLKKKYLELFRNGELFKEANLSWLDLSGFDFSHINMKWSNFEGAVFFKANLQETNLQGANLSGAFLNEANLTNANLTRANLTKATLQEANLANTNLTGANLTQAIFNEADLTKAIIEEAILPRTVQ